VPQFSPTHKPGHAAYRANYASAAHDSGDCRRTRLQGRRSPRAATAAPPSVVMSGAADFRALAAQLVRLSMPDACLHRRAPRRSRS
jgi:hypothetical protein